ncbi:esterase family protein [Gordonia sp. TBRC 11910]|uniref:Esterase family protein n=1 Tax=Gordonia asplenii TaxID=2725283 RepID=A0A848L466_9ACTN|nr:alpha/beta hydrolase family protein [Gordonia asplenii]NMO03845.1 esterase family protein [Gordonia asplenii]
MPIVATVTAVVAALALSTGPAVAAPAPPSPAPSPAPARPGPPAAIPGPAITRVVATRPVRERLRLRIYSASMQREVVVDLQRPKGAEKSRDKRPTLYMLDGAEARDDQSGWYSQTDVGALASTQNVNVVTPVGDPHSYYTDWQRVDPGIGRKYMWETFLTRELPPIIDHDFGGSGRNAIAGASMGGLAALTLAMRRPDLYTGVAGFSDCANISSGPNKFFTEWDISRGGGNSMNMWGKFTDPDWAAHDPYVHADQLAGKTIYISSGNGIPASYNNLAADPMNSTLAGMFLEFGSALCTGQMSTRLKALNIAFTSNLRSSGTHRWEYWKDELHVAWPVLMNSLGLSAAPAP